MGIEENKHSDGGEVKQICQKSMLLGYYAVKKLPDFGNSSGESSVRLIIYCNT